MPKLKWFTIICMGLLLVFVYGCNKASEETGTAEMSATEHEQAGQAGEGEEASTHESEQGEHEGEGRGEHAGEGEQGEHEGEERGEHGEEGEETGPRLAKDGPHDEIRKGVRLILTYDSESSSFVGTVENMTEKTVSRVRIEVHLSNGTELGPTPPIDLAPGKKVNVGLSAEGQSFEWWKAHAESGVSEH